MNNSFDFRSELRDVKKFLNDRLGSSLANYEYDLISDYSDDGLRVQVIEELLSVTMWEVQTGLSLVFMSESLLRFIPHHDPQGLRILESLTHSEIQKFIVFKGDQIRLKKDHQNLQSAMEYCGTYYSGFIMPEGCILSDHDAGSNLLNKFGSIENIAASLVMDLMASIEGPCIEQ